MFFMKLNKNFIEFYEINIILRINCKINKDQFHISYQITRIYDTIVLNFYILVVFQLYVEFYISIKDNTSQLSVNPLSIHI